MGSRPSPTSGGRNSTPVGSYPPAPASFRPSQRIPDPHEFAGVELVLLDNFGVADTRAAVDLVRGTRVRLEASGGLSLDRAAEVAATGVDYLAVGALTHSAPVLDLGFDLRSP